MHNNWLRDFRHRLADAGSLLHLSILGVISGISCSLVILAFRFIIEAPSALWLPDHNPDNFEALPTWLHFALPLIGALLIGLALRKMASADIRVGVPHVITRLHAYHGHLPAKNALVQFFAGAFAIATGQSGGREGPAIHLGAAANSLLGQKLLLPNNSLRVLVGCGTAAAIAASFNTPIAGVIFAMEVIMMEYTIAGFTPVILAAITGTALTRAVYGSETLFAIPTLEMASLWELPFIAFLGLITGACASLFILILKSALRLNDQPILLRMFIAGSITATCALLVPEVMGIGYDTVNDALSSQLPLSLLLAIIAAKILATATSSGLGMPIGLIGPNLLIGACIGSALGALGELVFPELTSSRSFYVMLGMAAMMGAVLNAPLAALMALLEMSNNTSMIFPAMLAITVATLTNSEIFKQRSAHQTALLQLKQRLATDPVSLALQRTSVATIMQRDITRTNNLLSGHEAKELLLKPCQWYFIDDKDQKRLRLIQKKELVENLETTLGDAASHNIDLLSLGTYSQPVINCHIQATLREALSIMDHRGVDAVYVSGYISDPYPDDGIVTRTDIERYYNTPQ
ncbi:MAG: chloride channel protein [Spongiibacteraceae bacterium]|nr:chloride channel protein [Spongiibacteraceae bacterium]